MLRKIGIIAVLSLIVAALAAVPALAQNPHFVRGPIGTDEGTTLLVTGKVAGLGSDPVNIVIDAEGLATVECTNPGGNVAPGQDTEVDASGQTGPITPRNGQITFSAETLEPTVPNFPTCPNPQWTANVTDVEFSSATATVFDEAGNILLGPVPVTIR
jgi:hypothetical protein